VLKGLKKKKKLAGSKSGLPAMLSFPEGMEQLTCELARNKEIYFNSKVKSIAKEGNCWKVAMARSGRSVEVSWGARRSGAREGLGGLRTGWFKAVDCSPGHPGPTTLRTGPPRRRHRPWRPIRRSR